MTTDDLRTAIERVGGRFDLDDYEIAAYLALVEHGRLTASEISDRTEIPQPRVYDTVRSLADKELVELQESRPLKAIAIDPEEAFADVRSSLDDLVERLERRYTAPARDLEAVTLVRSRATILRYLEEVIESAEYELVLSASPDMLARFEDELRDRHDAGVTTELLLSPADEVPGADEYDYTAVATETRVRRGVTTPVVAIADGSYSVYAPRKALQADYDRYSVVFNRSELGFLVSGFLNTVVWSSAQVIEGGPDVPAFPHRYATIRRCVSDLSGASGEFYASVRGRDVRTGGARTVAGRIVDVSVGTNLETAAITVETDDGLVDVGGQVAALEDVEAYEIRVDRGSPPEL